MPRVGCVLQRDGMVETVHKHHKGANVIAITDNHGDGVAPVPMAPAHTTDLVLFPEGLKALQQVATAMGVALSGA